MPFLPKAGGKQNRGEAAETALSPIVLLREFNVLDSFAAHLKQNCSKFISREDMVVKHISSTKQNNDVKATKLRLL